VESNQQQQEFIKNAEQFVKQDLTGFASNLHSLLEKSKPFMSESELKQVDAAMNDLSKIPEMLSKIKR